MSEQRAVLENMHHLFLEALRHREQEVLRYVAILVPAVGGFLWLMQTKPIAPFVFAVGVCSVILVLLLGAVYSLALGYNYRYITLQLAKLEAKFGIHDYMLEGWPRSPEVFMDRYRLRGHPWCAPPEVIKVFWWAFTAGIVGASVVACIHMPKAVVLSLVIVCGTICLLLSLAGPWYYGRKLATRAEEERGSWDAETAGGTQ